MCLSPQMGLIVTKSSGVSPLPQPHCRTKPTQLLLQVPRTGLRSWWDGSSIGITDPVGLQWEWGEGCLWWWRSQRSLLPPLFVTPTSIGVWPPEEESLSSVSASSALPGSAAPTSVRHDFPLMMTTTAGHAGLKLPPPWIPESLNFLHDFTYRQNHCRKHLFSTQSFHRAQ